MERGPTPSPPSEAFRNLSSSSAALDWIWRTQRHLVLLFAHKHVQTGALLSARHLWDTHTRYCTRSLCLISFHHMIFGFIEYFLKHFCNICQGLVLLPVFIALSSFLTVSESDLVMEHSRDSSLSKEHSEWSRLNEPCLENQVKIQRAQYLLFPYFELNSAL